MYISNNSYRVLGVVSNASLKDVQKNISKLKAFAKIGKQMDLDYDFSCLNLSKLNRIDDLLLKSESQIKLDKNRIKNSLFWFVDINPIDSVALSHLIKGDVVKSIEIWDKVIKSNEVNSKNFSAYSNLSTLLLFSSLDESKTDSFKKDSESSNKIKRAFKLKQELISSTYYNEYCESISKSIPITSDDAQEFFTTTVIDVLNKNYSAKELSKLFEGLDNQLVNSLTESLTDKPISSIKNHIDTASILLKKDEKSGIKSGKQLIKDSLADFKQLKEVLSPDDFKFQTISDALANQILQCGILCFNATGDDQAYLSSYKYALQVAVGDKTKNRAIESIKHCEDVKKANICKSCQTEIISNTKIHKKTIYKVTNRTRFPSSVEYKYADLELYFCVSCDQKIKDHSTRKIKIYSVSIVVGLVLGLIYQEEIVLFVLFSLILGFLINMFFFPELPIPISKHKTYRNYLNKGWQTSKPSA